MASLRKRNGKWQTQVRRAGSKPRAQSFMCKADAKRWIRQTELELDRTPLAYNPLRLEDTIVADLITRYRHVVTPSKRGAAAEDKQLEVFLRYKWASLPLSKATPQVFSRQHDQRAKEVGPGTIIREFGLLRAVFEIARREWDIPSQENPLAKVKKPKAPQGRERRLKDQDFEWALEAAQDSRNDWLTPCILLAVDTGMRRGELLNIRARDVKTSEALLTIPETKTGYARCIPLTDRAVAILRERIGSGSSPDDLLFPVSSNAFRKAWEHCKM